MRQKIKNLAHVACQVNFNRPRSKVPCCTTIDDVSIRDAKSQVMRRFPDATIFSVFKIFQGVTVHK